MLDEARGHLARAPSDARGRHRIARLRPAPTPLRASGASPPAKGTAGMAGAIRPPKLPKLSIPKRPNLNSDEEYDDVFEEMTLAEHLEDFRKRLVRACLGIGLMFIVGFILAPSMLELIRDKANAAQGLDIRSPTEPFVIFMKIALYIAIGLAAPIIVWQLIGFLSPGLTRREKRVLYYSLPFISLLFIGGALFAFLIAAPRAFAFLSGFQSQAFNWEPDGNEVINFYMTLMIGMGLAFEIPIVMFLLAQLKVVSVKRMAAFRRYAAILIMVLAAIITPTPDPFNMLIVAAPMFVLYEAGLILGRIRVKF
jgi:sec-independent protein translocase protein TatC